MNDLSLYFDLAIDSVCFMPPLDEATAIMLTRDQSVFIAFGAMGLLVVAVIAVAVKDTFAQNPVIAVVMAVCIAVLGFIGLEQETLKGIFLAGYPPLVIALRFGQGALVGERMSLYLKWWHAIVFLAFMAGLYYILKPLPGEILSTFKGVWAVLGVPMASLGWTRMMADAPLFRSPFCLVALFLVFGSTLAYVSTSPLERAIYQWALPTGLLVGVVGGRVSR